MRIFWIIFLTVIVFAVGFTSLYLWIYIKETYRWVFYFPACLISILPCYLFWFDYFTKKIK